MSKFLSSLADKAQSAINPYLQSHGMGSDQSTTPADSQGVAGKSHTLGSLQHQFRMLQQQYSSATPVQKIITAQKGIALDFDGASRDARTESREMYLWGQSEDADIKDVTDRLAYLNYVQGTLSGNLAKGLDEARIPLKGLRDSENELGPRRVSRLNLQTQISRIEHDQQRGMEQRLAELRQQLHNAELEDEGAEKELQIKKRQALKASEEKRWAALREYGEKLVLLAEASNSILSALPPIPPTQERPYTGAEETATARASLQHTLDNYKLGTLTHSFTPSAADLNRSDSRSFGVTHQQELSTIAAGSAGHIPPSIPLTPPATKLNAPSPVPIPAPHPVSVSTSIPPPLVPPRSPPSATSPITSPPPLNPLALNNAPAPVPVSSAKSSTTTSSASGAATSPLTSNVVHTDPEAASLAGTALPGTEGPTVAETGVPVVAGEDGPGPARGSLHALRSGSGQYKGGAAGTGSTAQGGYVPGYGDSSSRQYETAAEEKRRLKEERERDAAREAQGGGEGPNLPNPFGDEHELKDGAEPPPYQD